MASIAVHSAANVRTLGGAAWSRRASAAPLSLNSTSLLSPSHGASTLYTDVSARRSRCSVSRGTAVVVAAAAASDANSPTVADTKQGFLKAYRRPIPSIYNTVLQELLVQHHLIRYNGQYRYDPVLALGFVTVFDQLMDGYPYGQDNAQLIFKAYIGALGEDPEQYRADAKALEVWVQGLPSADSILSFAERDGEIEKELQAVAAAASGQSEGATFHYSRFFAVGLFRLLELSASFDPAVLAKLCAALNVPKSSVERDLDVYRGLLNKLTQAKDLLNDFLERERVKQAEREKDKAEA